MFVFETVFRIEHCVFELQCNWQADQGTKSEAESEAFKFPHHIKMDFIIACHQRKG